MRGDGFLREELFDVSEMGGVRSIAYVYSPLCLLLLLLVSHMTFSFQFTGEEEKTGLRHTCSGTKYSITSEK